MQKNSDENTSEGYVYLLLKNANCGNATGRTE